MRRSLLNKRILPKPLRQALLLITLFLLPGAAWGQATQSFYLVIGGNKDALENTEYTISTSTNGITLAEGGSVSFSYNTDNSTGTLTLKNATITNFGEDFQQALVISDRVNKLIIDLQGSNTIQTTVNSNVMFGNKYTDGKSEVIFTSSTGTGFLTLENKSADASASVVSNLTVNYQNELRCSILAPNNDATLDVNATKAEISIPYGLIVAGEEVTSKNKDDIFGNGTVSFTPESVILDGQLTTTIPAKLTLKGATIEGEIKWTKNFDFSVIINGVNSITHTNTGTAAIRCTYTDASAILSFEKAEGDGEKTLIIQSKGGLFSGFSGEPTIGAGLNSVKDEIEQSYMGITTRDVYELWIDDSQVHDIPELKGYKGNILGEAENSTVSFDSTGGKLTLNNASLSTIKSQLSSLTINLIGNNRIDTSEGYSLSGTGTITFTSSSTPIGSLSLVYYSDPQSPTTGGLVGSSLTHESILYDTQIGLVPTFMAGGDTWTTATEAVVAKGTATGLKIANVIITNDNASDILCDGIESGSGSVKFNISNNTLTLDGAEITGEIEWTKTDQLTITLSGTNKITSTPVPSIIGPEDGSLTFVKANAESCRLTLVSGEGSSIFGFESPYVAENSGLYYFQESSSSSSTTSIIISGLSGGDGSSESLAMLIKNAEDLANFATLVNHGEITNQYIKLDDDVDYIDCSKLEGFEIIGGSAYKFTGTFDGNEKAIKDLSVKGKGLFYTDSYAPIKVMKLTLDNLTVKGLNTNSGQIGAIASELWSGEIEGCVVKNSLITCENNFGNPWIGGIVGANYGGTITNCIVEDTEITASTENTGESGPNSKAGGIVCYNSGSISGCQVKGNTIVTAAHTISSDVSAGAIVCMNGATGFTNNTYEYTVKTQTKGSGDNGYNTKDKYIHRGTGSANYDASANDDNNSTGIVKDPDGIAMYTKKVIIPLANNQQSDGNVMVDLYYMKSGEDNTIYNVAPGEEIVLFVENYVLKGSYTLNGETEPITLNNTESNDWYSFDMPDADVTFELQKAAEIRMDYDQMYATYYNKTEDRAVPMGMTAYIVTGPNEDGTKVNVTRVSYIKKGVAVLIEKGNDGTEISETTDFNDNKMYYSDYDNPVKATESTKYYILYNNKFVKVTANSEIKNSLSETGACYLDLSGSAGTRGFYNIGDGESTTAIHKVISEGVNSEKLADGEWYTLQGQRVVKPAKGLYILNGKKVVVK